MEKDDRITPETMHRYCCLDEVDPALDRLVKHEVESAKHIGFAKGLFVGIIAGLAIAYIIVAIL